MKVSLVVPCYNVERYIGECLDSLYSQDIPESDYEVICVDDCSTDDTVNIINQYAFSHANLHVVFHDTNLGIGAARNSGYSHCVGDYVWFIDADDYLQPNVLSQLLSEAIDNSLDILMFNYLYKIDGENDIQCGELIYTNSPVLSGFDYLDRYFKGNMARVSNTWLKIIRRSFLEEHDFIHPNLRVTEDTVFSWKILFAAQAVASVQSAPYVYRVNQFSLTVSKNRAFKSFARCLQFPFELLPWLSDGKLREDYVLFLEDTIRYHFGCVFDEYHSLDDVEQSLLFNMLRADQLYIPSLKRYFGIRKRIVMTSRFFGKSIFDGLATLLNV